MSVADRQLDVRTHRRVRRAAPDAILVKSRLSSWGAVEGHLSSPEAHPPPTRSLFKKTSLLHFLSSRFAPGQLARIVYCSPSVPQPFIVGAVGPKGVWCSMSTFARSLLTRSLHPTFSALRLFLSPRTPLLRMRPFRASIRDCGAVGNKRVWRPTP